MKKRLLVVPFLVFAAAILSLPGRTPARAQGDVLPTVTLDPRPTLPPTWTPTFLPSETPQTIPTIIPSQTPAPTSTPWPTPQAAPAAFRLIGMRLVWQNYNRCAAAALTMMLFYHGWQGTLTETQAGLTPGSSDVSVRSSEMVAFTELHDLRAVVRTGGTLDMLRTLVSAGFPVLAENVYNPGGNDWMGHNRVVMGYDDQRQLLYTFDSVLGSGTGGQGRPIPYDDFDRLWQPFNRTYLVVYPPEAEGQIQALLGAQWNATSNALWTLEQAEAEVRANPDSSYAWFNVGSAHMALGHAAEAITAFDRARQIGLPWRFLWYQFGPFEAYLQLGRYQDAINLGREVLETSRGVEEVYYYMGTAYAAMGDVAQAEENYREALEHNRYYVEAELALDRLGVSVAGS